MSSLRREVLPGDPGFWHEALVLLAIIVGLVAVAVAGGLLKRVEPEMYVPYDPFYQTKFEHRVHSWENP